jgi:hypothetical protein
MRFVRRLALLVLLLGLAAAAGGWWIRGRLTTPYRAFVANEVFVELPAGASVASIARELEAAGVIPDAWTFRLAARVTGDDRRLMYVAMTRARDHLAVTYPLNAYSTRRGADYTIDQLSRFIDTGVRDTMQRVVPKFPDAHSAEVEPVAPLDLRELMKRRFGGT